MKFIKITFISVLSITINGCIHDKKTKSIESVHPSDGKSILSNTVIIDTGEDDAIEFQAFAKKCVRWGGNRDNSTFHGCDRRKAKTSHSNKKIEYFNSIRSLKKSLIDHDEMWSKKLSRSSNSGRTKDENRNIQINTYIYYASSEEDRDYHLIIGDKNCNNSKCFFNVEISGLPMDPYERSFLIGARSQFLNFFKGKTPGKSYNKYTPPIPVIITGSLFFDSSHNKGVVGPKCCRQETSWELHPVTSIEFIRNN